MVRATNLLLGLFTLDQEERFIYPVLDEHLRNVAYFFVIVPCLCFFFCAPPFLQCHIGDLSIFFL